MRNKVLTLLALGAAVHAAAGYTIALVPKMTSAKDFYGLVEQGCLDKAATIDNVTCVYNGTAQASVEGSLEILNNLIDDPTIDAISISVLDPEAYEPVINRGMALGKPIITFDSDAPESDRLAYVGTNNYAMGLELAKLLKQVKPDGGEYGMVSGFGLNLAERERGVRDGLLDSPWMEVEGSAKNGYEDSYISLQKMYELVEENDSLGAIVSVVGLPMFPQDTTNWTTFVDANRNVTTVIADTLDVQIDLMQTSYVDALVGQLPYNMGYQSATTLIQVLDAVNSGIPLNESLQSDESLASDESLPSDVIFGTHQLEVLRIPLTLPPLEFDYNYIGNIAIVGYVLCAIVIAASIGFTGWTWYNRKNQVVRSGQPVFLSMICCGTLLMGSAIIPLSIDDESVEDPSSQRSADIACMCSPWLINVGFTIAFSALFAKTWRLNQILLTKNALKRIKVTEKDVMWPLVVLLTLNVITLICWTTIAPLRFVRTLESGTDPWNRHIGSYGKCQSTSGAKGKSIPYVVVIAVINITALGVANFQAYRARNVRTEFNESSYIAMANASFLQAIFICVPILFLTRENPQAYFIVLSVVLFILSGALLGFMFIPKVIALKERKKMGSKKDSNVKISGVSDRATTLASSTGSSRYGSGRGSLTQRSNSQQASGDAVADAVKLFQELSWADRMAFKKKLSLSETHASSRSLEQYEHSTSAEISESMESIGERDTKAAAEIASDSKIDEATESNTDNGNIVVNNDTSEASGGANSPVVDEEVP